VKAISEELEAYLPDIANQFKDIVPYYYTDKEMECIKGIYEGCNGISIDYGVMEKTDRSWVFETSFGWSDVGTWGSLQTIVDKDVRGNALVGNNIKVYETQNCIIHTTEEKKVVVQGLDGYIVAEKGDTLLICKLSEEQRIKEFSE
jgi:mannose-1-phosphate guanylyltransferase